MIGRWTGRSARPPERASQGQSAAREAPATDQYHVGRGYREQLQAAGAEDQHGGDVDGKPSLRPAEQRIDDIFIDGSFCTEKPDPGDVDGYWVDRTTVFMIGSIRIGSTSK